MSSQKILASLMIIYLEPILTIFEVWAIQHLLKFCYSLFLYRITLLLSSLSPWMLWTLMHIQCSFDSVPLCNSFRFFKSKSKTSFHTLAQDLSDATLTLSKMSKKVIFLTPTKKKSQASKFDVIWWHYFSLLFFDNFQSCFYSTQSKFIVRFKKLQQYSTFCSFQKSHKQPFSMWSHVYAVWPA